MSNVSTFTIPAGIKLSKVASKDHGRWVTDSVAAVQIGEQAYLQATNGRIAAVLPVSGTVCKPTLIPPVDAPANSDLAAEVNGRFVCKSGVRTVKETVCDLPEQSGRFPSISRVLDYAGPTVNPFTVLSLDADLLHALAHAIGSGNVTLLIPAPSQRTNIVEGAILAIGTDGEANPVGLGAIMPLALKADGAREFLRKHCDNLASKPDSLTFTTEPA